MAQIYDISIKPDGTTEGQTVGDTNIAGGGLAEGTSEIIEEPPGEYGWELITGGVSAVQGSSRVIPLEYADKDGAVEGEIYFDQSSDSLNRKMTPTTVREYG